MISDVRIGLRAALPRRLALATAVLAPCSSLPPRAAAASTRRRIVGPDWETFKSRFVSPAGRVVDPNNSGVSYSESQAWGLLLAEHHADREAFLRILSWTRAHLAVRPDSLLAWRYRTESGGLVDDPNNATDADLYHVWALFRAARRWPSDGFQNLATAVASDIRRRLVRPVNDRVVLLPGAWGFEHAQSTVVNPSYYVFPALDALNIALPDPIWARLGAEGERLLLGAQFGRWALPPDWVSIARSDGRISILQGRGERFSYDAIRVPLHLVWSRRLYSPVVAATAAFWTDAAQPHLPAWTVLTSDAISPYAAGPGIRAIASLVTTATSGPRGALPPPASEPSNLYHDALALLAQVAALESGLVRPQA